MSEQDRAISIVQQLEREANEVLEKRLATVKDEISEMISNALHVIVGNALGMKYDHWHGWEIDHTNGRASAIVEKLGGFALSLVKSNMKATLEGMFPDGRVPEEWLKGFRAEVKAHFGYHMQDAAKKIATKLIEDHVASVVNDVKAALEKKLDAEQRLKERDT